MNHHPSNTLQSIRINIEPTKIDRHHFLQIVGLFILALTVGIAIAFLEDYIYPDSSLLKNLDDFIKTPIFALITIVLIVPPLEEFMFRLPLKRVKYSITSLIFGIPYIILSIGERHWWIATAVALVNFYMLFQYRFKRAKKFPPILVIVSIALFAMMHLGNWGDDSYKNIPWYVNAVFMIPFFVGGTILTYIKAKIQIFGICDFPYVL